MRTRIMSGAVLIVILFTCLYFGGWVTFGFSLFISLVGMYELIKVKKLEKTGLAVVGYIAAITYYFILLLNDPAYILLLLVASCLLMMSVYVFTFPKYKTEDVMWVFFSIVYVAVTLSYIYQVRMLQDGIYIVWLIFVSSWGNDTCAYFTGVFLGKHKMTPKLSPTSRTSPLILIWLKFNTIVFPILSPFITLNILLFFYYFINILCLPAVEYIFSLFIFAILLTLLFFKFHDNNQNYSNDKYY